MNRTISGIPVALLAAWLLVGTSPAASADSGLQVIPLAQYQMLSLESQKIHSPGAGVIVVGESLFLAGLYNRHSFTQDLDFDYPDTYHSIELMADGRSARHRYMGAFQSRSNRPVVGGLRTFQAVAVYGYEVVQQPRFSLVLGGGLAVSDFGIETSGGNPWPILPVPMMRAAWESRLLNANLDFITGPNLGLTLAPQSRFRATADVRIDQLRDERDLFFEGALVYRFFSPDHPMGDLAGVAVGIKSDAYEFTREAEDESLELHYYALFATVDLTLLKLSGGYAFDSRLRYRERVTESAGDGWFISVSALYPLGGSRDDR
ncbi:MAG: hypothetical protein EA403_14205 [Spirochaetaceae bacterium]|nr:MAG: hypothetical protein EA403_14205 [Spirochaetaceae bacterium]